MSKIIWYKLCIVEFLLFSQVFCLQQVVSDRSGLDGIDQVQNRHTTADRRVLHRSRVQWVEYSRRGGVEWVNWNGGVEQSTVGGLEYSEWSTVGGVEWNTVGGVEWVDWSGGVQWRRVQ